MANRKDLKKDLKWLTNEVITDCFIYLDFNKNKNEDAVSQIINNMLIKYQELISKINLSTSTLDRKEVKNAFYEITKDLYETANKCFEELSTLSKK